MNPLDLSPERVDREIGLRGSFYQFVQIAWTQTEKMPLVGAWYIKVICDALEALWRGEVRNLVINIPPGMGKSSLTCVFWPAWVWLREPRAGILSLSVSHEITIRDSGKSLALIHRPWFQARWGDLVAVDPGAGTTKFATHLGGVREAQTFGGQVLGKHPDVVIIDDPIKPQMLSPATLAYAKRFWVDTLSTRAADPKTVRRVCIMQRLHVEDLAGVFIAEGWELLRLPMRFEPESADPRDQRTKPGELLAPERAGEAEVQKLERNGERFRASQLQQRPFPEGGAIIKSEWIQWYDPKKAPRFSSKIQTWDLTFKATNDSDHVAGQVWGTDENSFYFIDGILERLDFVATCEAILGMSTHHPDAIGILIEDKANGPAVMSMLETKVAGIIPVEPLGGKGARLNAVAPLFEAKNVFLPIGHPVAEQLALHLQAFPSGDIDDDVDACTQVLNHLHGQVLDYEAAMKGLKSF
jgi:predicted phage terminase large subunit-like protein